ncbi:hypothetical protein [Pseudofrankia sp. BMG5.37]|uniref:hypothetical protein n=1 Tax=Pseudofrankia sp. BMG5.37 TaxID=3050035 RepID=UPI00289383DD|nr:hypothetical protein [Pseudofrankia sp. BMG5.37]MDT3444334.1 hypothetical protein [Pseudofrankia sp. BMG5.37]
MVEVTAGDLGSSAVEECVRAGHFLNTPEAADGDYLYTYGTPPGDSLLSALLEYVSTDTAKNLLRGEGFTPCVDRDKNLMATLCATRR